MDRHEYMTTGEFASAMGVSKDTLFHYDDIGLFCPEKVSENGYRYYSIYQMETFDTIRMLRDLHQLYVRFQNGTAEYRFWLCASDDRQSV